jgi:FkbM family methyltransferase
MERWYASWLQRTRSKLTEYPRVFHGAKTMFRLALLPRQQMRKVVLRWQTRGFNEEQLVEAGEGARPFSIYVDPRNGPIDATIYATHRWGSAVGAALERLLPAGGTFVDVGANIGYFSLLAARVVGEQGTIVAFEPIPRLVDQARRSADASEIRNIRFVAAACGAEPGSAMIEVDGHDIGTSSLAIGKPTSRSMRVKVVKLDDELCDEPRVDVIKIDVEGYELDVLRGATQVLARHAPTVIVEYSPTLYERMTPGSSEQMLTLLRDQGYALTLPSGAAIRDPHAFTRELLMRNRQYDLICVPTSRRSR